MKTIQLTLGLILFAVLINAQTYGQTEAPKQHNEMKRENHFNKDASMIPNLTEEQKAKIKEFRLAHFKEAKTFRNELGELKAKQRTLTTADKADLKAINANIDEITKVLGQLMKSKAQLNQQIRSLLTDEQRIFFDIHGMKGMGELKMQHEKRQHEFRHEQIDGDNEMSMPMQHMN
jgi:Spy/CpxP family protein refolding chaperone